MYCIIITHKLIAGMELSVKETQGADKHGGGTGRLGR